MNDACEVPLIEQLRSVPKDYHTTRAIQWSENGTETGHHFIPVGFMMHRAADKLAALQQQVAELTAQSTTANKVAAEFQTRFLDERKAREAAEVKLAQVEQTIRDIGRQCVVDIIGCPDEYPEEIESCIDAIKEALRLGMERNNEANWLRVQLFAAEIKLAQVGHASPSGQAEPTSKQCEPLNEFEIKIIERAKQRAVTLMDSVTAELCIYYCDAWQKQAETVALRNYVDLHIVEATGNVRAVLEDIDHILQDSEALYASPSTAPGIVSVPREPTEMMIEAYLLANAAYWVEHDKLPSPIGKWRSGTAKQATVAGYRAMLAAASKESAAGQDSRDDDTEAGSNHCIEPAPAADPQMPT